MKSEAPGGHSWPEVGQARGSFPLPSPAPQEHRGDWGVQTLFHRPGGEPPWGHGHWLGATFSVSNPLGTAGLPEASGGRSPFMKIFI